MTSSTMISTRLPSMLSDDCFDDDIDAAAFDAVVSAATSAPPPPTRPTAGPSSCLTQKKYTQTTIFGASQVPAKPTRASKQSTSSQYQPPVPRATQQEPQVKKVKKWDTLSAIKVLPDILQDGKQKRKKKSRFALLETAQKPVPMKLESDPEAIKTWIYSINKPKRKYQYDIVARALYNNCLIEACHSIAGIPSVDCVSLTGTTSAAKRAIAWREKRVIFATPQTVANDLRRGSLRPEDIICLVVDEAHRATGAYAYCIVVKLLMRFNPHFRVLALTATPGSDPERVQAVIDNLHIGHIEVRTEESMDIVPYTKNKEIVLEKISLTPELASIRDKWGTLMLPLIKQCGSLFHGSKEPAYIHAFSITAAQMHIPKEKSYLRPNLAVLSKMATAMAKLLEYSITLAFEKMQELKEESGRCAAGVCSQMGYKSLMSEIRELTQSAGFVPHPKMEKMKALVLEFFVEAQEQGKSSRVMIFCHFRDMVTDIVNYLNQERPLIKASAFVGQSNDVRGNRGMNQKTQNETIQRFKNNEFNVLVATSIGEEGLDIGALDFIICYEAQKSPLRMLQRLGRTGRNEDGKVIVLIAEGREDKNWEKAQDQYQHVQNALLSKKVLELYEDCERLVPEEVRPTPVDKELDVQPYIAEQVELAAAPPSGRKKKEKATKRKRPGVEDIPAGGVYGFVSAKDYAVGPKSKAEGLRQRAEAALLTDAQAAELARHWARNISSVPAPIDPTDVRIESLATKSELGSRLDAVPPSKRMARNILPSQTYARLMGRCAAFVDDEACYEQWRDRQVAGLESSKLLWWPVEARGTGAQKPFRFCSGGPRSVARRWTPCAEESPVPPVVPSSPRLLSSPSAGGVGIRGSSQVLAAPSSMDDELPEVDAFIPSARTSSKPAALLPPPPIVARSPPVVSTSSAQQQQRLADSTRADGQSSGFRRLAGFKSAVAEPAPFQADVPVRRREEAPVTPRGPSGEPAAGTKRLLGRARFADAGDEQQSPLLVRARAQNRPPAAPPLSPSEYSNGDAFVAPLPTTQMPRARRRPALADEAGLEARAKRTIAADSADDESDDERRRRRGAAAGKARAQDPPGPARGPKKTRVAAAGKGKQKEAVRGNEWALKTGLSEEIASENSVDRDFLVEGSSSSRLEDACSPDKSMASFYRASILMMSQPLSVVRRRLGRPRSPPPPAPPVQLQSTSRLPDSSEPAKSDDRFSFDSFCVPDEQTIEYDDIARLVPTLNQLPTATLFAPTNQAIANAPALSSLLAAQDNVHLALRQTLLYHLLNASLPEPKTSQQPPELLDTLLFPQSPDGQHKLLLGHQPQKLRIALRDQVRYIGVDARGLAGIALPPPAAFRTAPNATLVPIQAVLSPPPSLQELLRATPDLSSYLAILPDRLLAQLSLLPHLTLFAPVNAAWDALSPVERAYLRSSFSADDAAKLFRQAAADNVLRPEGVGYAHRLRHASSLLTLDGKALAIGRSPDSDRLSINGSEVVEQDILASNGVLHIVPNLLISSGDNPLQLTAEKYLLALNCTKFVSLFRQANLSSTYLTNRAPSNYTILAVRDDALASASASFGRLDTNDTESLRKSLRYHVLEGTYLPADLRDGMMLPTELAFAAPASHAKQRMPVSVSHDEPSSDQKKKKTTAIVGFGGANVLGGDPVQVGNTAIYILSQIVAPPADLLQVALSDIRVSTGVASIFSAKLEDALRGTAELTYMMPTNRAFGRLGLVMDYLLLERSKAELGRVLRYHGVAEPVYLAELALGASRRYPTLEPAGAELFLSKPDARNVSLHGPTLAGIPLNGDLRDARVLSPADSLTANGNLLLVDQVLLPPSVPIDLRKLLLGAKAATMLELLQKTNFDWILNTTHHGTKGRRAFTVLCPSDAAFTKINLTYFLEHPQRLTALVQQHLIPVPRPGPPAPAPVDQGPAPLILADGAVYPTLLSREEGGPSQFGAVFFRAAPLSSDAYGDDGDGGKERTGGGRWVVGIRGARASDGSSHASAVLRSGRTSPAIVEERGEPWSSVGGVLVLDHVLVPYLPSLWTRIARVLVLAVAAGALLAAAAAGGIWIWKAYGRQLSPLLCSPTLPRSG
ncbi:hypothetical protein PtB15_1B633 [Puccinia triticina]|nr:hypothetical protein PtB15_1B633 [Puccinia triticina]